ncbi:hypothetical protein G0Q06_09960 [Puniceicoccales bacterium CK1056]|uniref:Uncharacterized protein n=1 Tax=Oceanipulchritudo coccoides TaxID=2706888 RepID=A0A6B2M4K9_9BACT|nr:hypothetical protein [Oceanipulchritudo coccoides]
MILFFFVPSWQKAAVEEVLSHDQARRWQIGTVGLGPVRVEASDIFVLEGPVGIEVASLQVDGPFWLSPASGVIEIESGHIKGFNLDASRLRVGDLTSEDWQTFLKRISTDASFWEERTGLVLQKLAATGWDVSMTEVLLEGSVLMPGNTVVPVSMKIIQADSRGRALPRIKLLSSEPRQSL